MAGHLVVSSLQVIINKHHQGVGANAIEVKRDASEEIPPEVWRSLKQPPPLNKPEADVVDGSESVPP